MMDTRGKGTYQAEVGIKCGEFPPELEASSADDQIKFTLSKNVEIKGRLEIGL